MEQRNGSGADRPEMRWNGWGDPSRAKVLPLAVRGLLPLLLGRVRRPPQPPALEDVLIRPSRLTADDVAALEDSVGADAVDVSTAGRLRHAGGRSTPDLLRRRALEQDAPDAVVSPADHDAVRACLALAGERGLAVIPFGGGTSVVGALDPEPGPHRAVLSLDLRRLSGLLHLDTLSGEATLAAGTTGPDAEAQLSAHGLELGHFPQSFRYATIGGFAAARSSGQNSAGNGRFEAMVTGIRVATPTGDLDLGRAPGSAAGPDLLRLFLGSEGILGVITEVRVRVHPVPTVRIFESWTFPDFAGGADALRRVVQQGAGPTVIRLSDEAETAVSLAQVGRIGKALAKGASVVTVYEGDEAAARRDRTAAILAAAGGRSAGTGDAEEWAAGRFDGPYLRDALLDAGVFCETLETATTWSNLRTLKEAVEAALRDGFDAVDARSYVMCHVSHVYPTGASLYFTVLAGLRREPLGAWAEVKGRVNDAILANGGTISHHHAVGRDHAPWLAQEIGETGVRILTAVKRELDPRGIMNPGAVLVDVPTRATV
ncbi:MULTISPECIES: FAD-binding oxidoreductase [unclassified Microbacterium]|uniref:FAD-binding oxidoreductase n=1 Tax=unclassified Microbacterium TaxID=2609290 RepID=UPI0024684FEA|nr:MULTISPECIES: FAD-binding oxidoreductase [unclassified Microbacterium]MDH5133686.1 FAD-binding oxidoreductase [Microbacterium sp. RD10]MDH5135337.1 FAD-binding oxidoreductase [Microbacterium sp. RD11]MDH5144284.1 FAD-binding oxidoreductase [Microbacterium sp. RD12]MDH5155312.1 FAD-binding oxidoreductase [Microbacterium sp. RD06]MDH5165463.1 FAD-binding oxidoreductase [Microbacterium sp. RD02]